MCCRDVNMFYSCNTAGRSTARVSQPRRSQFRIHQLRKSEKNPSEIMFRRTICVSFIVTFIFQSVFAQTAADGLGAYNDPPSRLRGVIEKFDEDYGCLTAFIRRGPRRSEARGWCSFMSDELAVLSGLNFGFAESRMSRSIIFFSKTILSTRKRAGEI